MQWQKRAVSRKRDERGKYSENDGSVICFLQRSRGMNINLREIQYVLTIAEERSITKAAYKLFMSQPSLSQSLKKIETEVGTSLFIRTPSKLILTPAGKLFVDTGKELIEKYMDMRRSIDEIDSVNCGTVRFGLPLFLSSFLYPQITSHYRSYYPDNNILLSEAPSIELEEQLSAGELDLIIVPQPIFQNKLVTEPLFSSHMVLVMGIDDPLNQFAYTDDRQPGKQFIDLRLAGDREFLLGLPSQRIHFISEIIFRKANIAPKSTFCSRSINTIQKIAADGNGLSLIPLYYLEKLAPNQGIRYYYLSAEYDYLWTLVVAYRSGSDNKPLVTALKNIIIKLCQSSDYQQRVE